jgi:murein L,D-transpeptidase YafK
LRRIRNLCRIAPLLLLLATIGAGEPLPLPEIDFIRIDKSERTMELHANGALVRVIRGIQLGGEPAGPKHFEGDQRTPEGLYEIDWANPDSAYYLSLHISYPNEADRAYAAAKGRSPGGMIMIHGQPNALPAGRIPGDWTDGCIAVSNEEMEALWASVPDGTLVEIDA